MHWEISNEESKDRFERMLGDRVDIEVADLKLRLQQLSMQAQNIAPDDDFEGDRERAIQQISTLAEAVEVKSGRIDRRISVRRC